MYGTVLGDDAAIYALTPELHLVQTVDFFPPIVDDPFAFGQIAAANALSDVYAVGGRPLTALCLVGFPSKVLPLEVLEAILAGAARTCAQADCTIVGGHTIEDAEPKFGLAVTGVVDPNRAVLNSGARPGDDILLTKAIGTGIVANAIKQLGRRSPGAIAEAMASMTALNRTAAEWMFDAGATAATDVTGFGLLAHLHNLLTASGCAATLRADAVPVFESARALLAAGHVPGGSRRNLEAAAAYADFSPALSADTRLLLADAQTSGGLCLTLSAAATPALLLRPLARRRLAAPR